MSARSRPTSALLVVLLHLAVVALVLVQRARPQVESAAPAMLQVSLGESHAGAAQPPPPVPVSLEQPSPMAIVLPDVQRPPEPISLPAPEVAVAAPPGVVRGDDSPMLVQPADYLRKPYLDYYPRGAKRRGEQGTAFVLVRVGTDGEPRDARLYRSSGFRDIDAAAIKAVYNALFKPRLVNGEPREVWAVVPVEFTITKLAGRQ